MQVTNGILSVLNNPFIYNLLQNLVGANKVHKSLVTNYIMFKGKDKILDIGCGTGEILKYLPKDVEYHGYDLSSRYIENAKQKHSKIGKFYCADTTQLTLETKDKFDLVFALGLLHHLDDEEVTRLFNFVKNILKPDGCLVTNDNCYTQTQSKIAKFIISKDRGKNVRTPRGYRNLAEQSFNNIKVDIREDLLRIPYTNIIMTCS